MNITRKTIIVVNFDLKWVGSIKSIFYGIPREMEFIKRTSSAHSLLNFHFVTSTLFWCFLMDTCEQIFRCLNIKLTEKSMKATNLGNILDYLYDILIRHIQILMEKGAMVVVKWSACFLFTQTIQV